MKIFLISRQFSQTFRCIKKSTNFQNDFNEINPIFPKSKHTMSEPKKHTKSSSSLKTTDEDTQKSEKTASHNSYSNDYHKTRMNGQRGRGGQRGPIASDFSSDGNINSYNFHNNRPIPHFNYSQSGFAFNTNPSYYQPSYYQMNSHWKWNEYGQMYCLPTTPSYYPPFAQNQSGFVYKSNSMQNRMYSQKSDSISGEQLSEKVMKFRQMIKIKSYDETEANDFRFSIMTYNILSQNLLEEHSTLYQHCQQSALSWPKRGERILKELLDSDCDIFCLQEVNSQHFDELYKPALKERGYNSVFKQRTGGKLDGCAIIYKEDKFRLLNEIKLDFMRKDLSSLLDRDNIAIIVELKPKEWNRDTNLIVANTHLLYNPKRGDVKLAQIRLLLAEIDKIAKISEKEGVFDYNPIILCGDLNSEPNSLLYNFITKGLANFNGLKVGDISGQKKGFGRGKCVEDHHLHLLGVTSDTRFEKPSDNQTEVEEKMSIKHNFKLKSVVFNFENKFGQKLISTSNNFDSALVDYIFYDFNKLKLRAFQKLLTENQLPQIGYIPNSVCGSDHLSFKAIFSIV